MNRSWICRGLVAAAFIFSLSCFSKPALAKGDEVLSITAQEAGGYAVVLEREGKEAPFSMGPQTLVVRRVPVSQIEEGDQIWRTRAVSGFKGVSASVKLSPGASKWFGIPHIDRVAGVNALPDVPEKVKGDKKYDLFDDKGQTVAAVEKTPKGIVLTFKETGKKRTYAPSSMVFKVTSAARLKPHDRVLVTANDKDYLMRVVIEA